MMLPLAHFGHVVEALPFFVPALVLPVGIGALVLRDRRAQRRGRQRGEG